MQEVFQVADELLLVFSRWLSRENAGMWTSNICLSWRSIRNVPLKYIHKLSHNAYSGTLWLFTTPNATCTSATPENKECSKGASIREVPLLSYSLTYHICPLGHLRDTWLLYWKAGCESERMGSWPITPFPLTVSSLPVRLYIFQFLSLNWTCSPLRFSRRML